MTGGEARPGGGPEEPAMAAGSPDAPGPGPEEVVADDSAADPSTADPSTADPSTADDSTAGGTGQVTGLLPDLAALQHERDEYLGALQRLQADFENYRKRTQRQMEERSARAAATLVTKLLPILDVLDLARSHLGDEGGPAATPEAEALTQARSLLVDVLAKEGLERVDQAEVAFDPVVHDAVAHAPAEDGSGAEANGGGESAKGPTVDEVMRAGYRWQGQTLRPAMVRVRG